MTSPSAPAAVRRDVPTPPAEDEGRLLAGPSPQYRLGVVLNFHGNLEAGCAGEGLGARLPELLR